MGKMGFSVLMFSYFALTICANLQSKQVASRISQSIEQVSYSNGVNVDVDSVSVKDGYEIVESDNLQRCGVRGGYTQHDSCVWLG